MNTFRTFYPLIATLLFVNVAFSQVKYSNEFLNIGIGARAQGMSNAVSTSIDDITAGYWNPAGLAAVQVPFQLSVMHAEWFAGIAQYDYVAFGKKLNTDRPSAFALSFIRMGIDDIPYTLTLVNKDGSINYDNLSEFSAADYAVLVSYGQQLKNPRWSVGGTTKIIHRIIGTFGSAWGFGIDGGLIYQHKGTRFAVVAHDFTSTFNAWSFKLSSEEKAVFEDTENEIPENSVEYTTPRVTMGGSKLFTFSPKVQLLAALDVDITTDGKRNTLISTNAISADPHLGVELNYRKKVFLRTGVRNLQQFKKDTNSSDKSWTFQPDFGVGLQFGRLKLDYAFTDIGNVSQTLYSHVFSLTFNLKSPKDDE
ncbi:MAG: PorV/PorQ family protein [Saprospiraceae bacterium]|nr:PorV/PorQ family protein [Saprospiraceae bacterium]